MSFLKSKKGANLLNRFLEKFEGGSRKVYLSEIQQFLSFAGCDLSGMDKALLQAYQEKVGKEHSPKTTKRKFSMINGFFKLLEGEVKGFQNPITSLKEFKTHRGAESEDLKKYLEGFIASQNTAGTKKTYESLVKLFFEWAKKDLAEIQASDIRAYREELRKEEKSDGTVWNRFVAINRFFKYVEHHNRKFKNPIPTFKELSVEFPVKERVEKKALTQAESVSLLKQPDKKKKMGIRDLAMLYLMIVYGLRANEVAKLKYDCLGRERVSNQLQVTIADRKGRHRKRPTTNIILCGKSLAAFDAWLDAVKDTGIKPGNETPIFLPFRYDRNDGFYVIKRQKEYRPLIVMAIENIVSKYMAKAGIKRTDSKGKEFVPCAHALRHTAFSTLARAGVNLPDIQYLAGHTDVKTTMLYIEAGARFEDHPGLNNPLNK